MPVVRILKEGLRALLRQPVFAPLFGWLLGGRLRLLHDSRSPDALNVLVFSDMRWPQDLAALARTGALRLYAIDQDVMRRINALFVLPGTVADPLDYFCEADPAVLRRRTAHAAFIARLVPALRRRRPLDCAVTPAIHYRQEHPWAEGLHRGGLPFVALHKEFTVLDARQLPERTTRFRGRRQTFLGSHICVTNRVGKALFAEAGVFPADRISVIGLLRMDNLLLEQSAAAAATTEGGRTVTLFSFGHVSGGLTLENTRSHYFSRDDDEGFVELFRDVHVAFAEAALRHPEVRFKIKPKNLEDWWICEIEAVIEQALGRPFSSIENCEIVSDPAPALIAESCATIGFNSTVLLESVVMGRNTIMPVFGEAKDKYPGYVFFPDFRDVFAVPGSKAGYLELIGRAIQGETLVHAPAARRAALFRYYLGYDDGRTAERAVAVLRAVAAGEKSPLSFAPEQGDADSAIPPRAAERVAAW